MSKAEELILDVSFTGRNDEYDKAFIVDGHKIRVLKDVLCLASPVFHNMLKRDFKEKGQSEVPLPGKKYQDFVEFLSCIYPNKSKQITDDSVYRILPLAFEYEVKELEKICQVFLVKVVKTKHLSDASEICRHIKLTVEYELLKDLRKICISAASDFGLGKMEKAASKHQIPDNILVQIHRLARRKQELNNLDDDFLAKRGDPMQYAVYLTFIEKEMGSSTRHADVSDEKDKIRAARLWYRYKQGNEELLEKIVKRMKGMKVSDDIKEEYELLPETIKQRLDVEFSEPESETESETESEPESETEIETGTEPGSESDSD